MAPFDIIAKLYRKLRGIRGDALLVDPKVPALYDGRLFRTFFDFTVANGQTAVIQLVAPCDFVLHSQTFSLDSGTMVFEARTGGTPAGTFATPVPCFGMNRTAYRTDPTYTQQVVMNSGGTHSGGTVVERVRLSAAAAANQRQTVGASLNDARILPAGTYFLSFAASAAMVGIHNIIIEEVPASFV